ncbi:MAG: GGDEF domain-containing protein [Acidobacteriota bacterium]
MTDFLTDKRKYVLWLQWLLVVAISYLLYFSSSTTLPAPLASLSLIILNAGLNAGLFFLPTRYFQHTAFDYTIVLLNILMVGLAIYMTGQATTDFYLFFFIILMMSAAGQSLQAFVLGVITASGLYFLMVYRTGELLVTEGFLLRIPFLFIVGLFFGYLVYIQNVGRNRLKAESEFTADLFEFGKALVQADDLHTLYSRIPKLINDIMSTDGCELALVDSGSITERILEGEDLEEGPSLAITQSIHNLAFESNEVFMATDLAHDDRLTQKKDAHQYPFQSYMGKSWKQAGGPSGLIAVYRHTQNRWSSHDQKKFRFLTDQTILGLQYAFVRTELENEARTDGLTGLANYRYFSERLEEEYTRAKRNDRLLSLVLVDLDHFKGINDTHGHAVGDLILQELASLLKITTRQMDLAGRCGGDEFVLLLPETGIQETQERCQRLLESLRGQDDSNQLPSFSISVGSSTFPDHSLTISELLSHADEALYYSKSQGRNCSYHYSEVISRS